MFALPLMQQGTHDRHGAGQLLSEAVATFGLLLVIHGTARRASVAPFSVGAYIAAAYWFTASTSFANPAVTLARAFTNTFSGIRPSNVAGFVAAECVGGLAATLLFRWLLLTNQTGNDA
jgi:glycerol uptake facilitator-like aquaporin